MEQCARCGEVVKFNESYMRVTVHDKELKLCDSCLDDLCSFLSKSPKKTYGNIIRNKNDEELADFLTLCFAGNKAACYNCAFYDPNSDSCGKRNECKQGLYLWLSKER